MLTRTYNESNGRRVSSVVGVHAATDVEPSALDPHLLHGVTCETNENDDENAK